MIESSDDDENYDYDEACIRESEAEIAWYEARIRENILVNEEHQKFIDAYKCDIVQHLKNIKDRNTNE